MQDTFFNRTSERQELSSWLYSRPSGILVVLGPRNSGKTAFLKEVFKASQIDPFIDSSLERQLCSNSEANIRLAEEADPTFFGSYVDAGECFRLQPDDLARILQQAQMRLKARMASAAQKAVPSLAASSFRNLTFALGAVAKAFTMRQEKTPSLSDAIASYVALLAQFSTQRQNGVMGSARIPWPVLCIDAAELLTTWDAGDRDQQLDLQALINFFILVRTLYELDC